MDSNNAVSEVPQAGIVSYTVPVTVSVDLDSDETFRAFTAHERSVAAGALVSLLTVTVPMNDGVTVSAGTAVVAA